VALAPGTAAAKEFSGLAYAGASQYYAVSDAPGAQLYELAIEIDPTNGHILTRSVVSPLALAAGSDLEGLVYARGGGSVLASDEIGPAIRRYRLSDGAVLGSVTVPAIFAQIRPNFSLESLSQRLAANPIDDALWTANEEALLVDGPLSTATTGTIVRLQRYDDTLAPDGQWAYVTDPYPGGPFLGQQRSGVADLLALENGELLVLERSFSDQLFRARIYQVDLAGATDTSALTSLATDPFTPATKTLLWQIAGVAQNYEGLAVGPALASGRAQSPARVRRRRLGRRAAGALSAAPARARCAAAARGGRARARMAASSTHCARDCRILNAPGATARLAPSEKCTVWGLVRALYAT
jgi:hypothetical protein